MCHWKSELSPRHHIHIKRPTVRCRLHRRLERIPTRKQRRNVHNLQYRRPILHAQRTEPIASITPRVRSERLVFERLASRTRGRGVDGVSDERKLKAVHGVHHPLLTLGIEQANVVCEFLTVILAIANRVSFRTAMISGLEAVGVEGALVPGWVCTCWISRRGTKCRVLARHWTKA